MTSDPFVVRDVKELYAVRLLGPLVVSWHFAVNDQEVAA